MGVRELSEVFAQAGVRLGDLPEFLEEQAEWARLDPPVQLFPNSRFGIGVLSYFMLADEITVETCRHAAATAQPGQRLRVSIAGPGSLFRIQTLGPRREAGTTVRLHLRDGATVSCVDTLRTVLWVADFPPWRSTAAERQSGGPASCPTPPRTERGPPQGRTSGARHRWRRPGGRRLVVHAATGAILADGLWAGREIFGAVVNLSRDSPRGCRSTGPRSSPTGRRTSTGCCGRRSPR